MSNVKFSQLEDTSANIETSKRPLLMGFDTTVKEIFYVDSAEDKYTAVTKDESGVVPSLEVSELTSDGNAVLTSVSVDGTTIDGNGTPSNPVKLAGARTAGTILKADANGLPVDSVIKENSDKIGIGTTTPANRLEVKNSAVNTTGIALQRFGGTQQIIRLFEDANGRGIIRVLDEGATDKIYLAADGDCYINPLNSGKLGVGTTTPAEKLDVNGIIRAKDALYLCNDNFPLVYLKKADNTILGGFGYIVSDETIRISNGATNLTTDTKIAIKKTGEVGIGTITPGQKLTVVGDGSFTTGLNGRLYLVSGDGTNNTIHTGIRAQTDVSNRYAEIVAKRGASSNVLGWEFKTYNTGYVDAMAILGNGNVGIGTTTPSEKLDVNGNAKAHSFIGSRKLYAAEAPNSYYGIQEDLGIETDDVDDYVDIDLPANTAIAHMILDVVVQHGSGSSQDYFAILDTWVHVTNNKVETTTRCENQSSERWLVIDGTLASGKVRIRLLGSTSGATSSRIGNVRGQIVEYMEALT